MNLPATGHCLCGNITYQLTEAPLNMGFCHCHSCQRETGCSALPFMFMNEAAVTLKGEISWYASKGSSGQNIHRGFCGNCGSILAGKLDALPEHYSITAGTLDDASQFKPQVDIWTEDAQPWDHMQPNLQKFAKNPD